MPSDQSWKQHQKARTHPHTQLLLLLLPPRHPSGICEPIRLDANDTGTRIGLGRRQEERQYTAAELVERRPLEAELQAEEDEGRKAKREVGLLCCKRGRAVRLAASRLQRCQPGN